MWERLADKYATGKIKGSKTKFRRQTTRGGPSTFRTERDRTTTAHVGTAILFAGPTAPFLIIGFLLGGRIGAETCGRPDRLAAALANLEPNSRRIDNARNENRSGGAVPGTKQPTAVGRRACFDPLKPL